MQHQTPSSLLHAQTLSYDEVRLLARLILDEPDHYTVLGVDPKASFEEINQSYCLAVTHFHPLSHRPVIDNDPVFQWLLSRAFTRLGTAYRILSNARRREIYDRSLKASQKPAAGNEPVDTAPGGDSLTDKEQLNLHSFSYATPEWLSAKRGEQEAANGERRRVVRVNMRIPVVVTCENHWQETGETRDLSPLGARLILTRQVEPGTLLRLQLRMPKQLRTRDYQAESYTVDACVLHVTGEGIEHLLSVEFI